MLRWLGQIVAVTLVSIRTIPRRVSSSVVAVIGIAGVVVVLVSVLSIAEGFKAAVLGTGSPNRAIVLRNGSQSEMTSGLTGPETDIIKQAPGIAQAGGRPVAAAELFVVVDLPKRSTGTPANVPIRGIEPGSLPIRPELKIVDGRAPVLGTNEAIVGSAAQRQFQGIDLGSTYTTGQLTLRIVGIFTANGSSAESEIWCDSKVLQGAYRRGNSYQSVLVQLDSPASFDSFKAWLTTNPQLNVETKREPEFYAGQTQVMTGLIDSIGYTISMLMALGAIFGAVLTMYTAVATRTREIATLRALGFNTTSVLVSVVGESLVLAFIGGVAGALLAYVGFNGYETSTMNFSSFSQIAFAFHVTPALLSQGLIWALAIGFLGGLFPAIRAARLPIASALREL
ncbi:MAG TPA: ABC transporter permease [Vicinamibacterales bacterium]|nr:ABC transporter permease [Vicinamibacterales bacterium]